MSIRGHRAGRWILVAAAALLVPVASWAQGPADDAAAAEVARQGTQGLIMKTEPPGLFLLYSGDVIGYIEPCG